MPVEDNKQAALRFYQEVINGRLSVFRWSPVSRQFLPLAISGCLVRRGTRPRYPERMLQSLGHWA